MSAIDEKIKKLKEQEKQLELEKRKVEFLRHILESAESYEHTAFKEVKTDVVKLLDKFVNDTIHEIEFGGPEQPAQVTVRVEESQNKVEVSSKPKIKTEVDLSPSEKLNFAMENRHLAGKKVSIANDQNITINGQVVGLDAPHVIVKTDTGPTIKVPLERVSLS